MRVLVDTSVWVDFFNGHDSREATSLARYIESDADICTCGIVLAEFFQGLRKASSIARLRSYFEAMLYFRPSEPGTYFAAADLYRRLRAGGVTVRSMPDCLIACVAAEGGAAVLAKDKDLTRILRSGLTAARSAPLLD